MDAGFDDDEREDLEVLPTDNMIVVARTEDEISSLEIHIYDETQEKPLCPSTILACYLPFPYVFEWLDFRSPAPSFSSQSTNPNGISLPSEPWNLTSKFGLSTPLTLCILISCLVVQTRQGITFQYPLGTGKKKRKKTKHPNITGLTSRRRCALTFLESVASKPPCKWECR